MLHEGARPSRRQRPCSIDALRGHLAEFGIVAAEGQPVSRPPLRRPRPPGRPAGARRRAWPSAAWSTGMDRPCTLPRCGRLEKETSLRCRDMPRAAAHDDPGRRTDTASASWRTWAPGGPSPEPAAPGSTAPRLHRNGRQSALGRPGGCRRAQITVGGPGAPVGAPACSAAGALNAVPKNSPMPAFRLEPTGGTQNLHIS